MTARTFVLNIFLALLCVQQGSRAATFYWDANGASPGVGGTGNWNTSSSLWRLISATGTLTNFVSIDTSDVFLTGTAGTLTLTSNITLHELTIAGTSGTYTITGQQLVFPSQNGNGNQGSIFVASSNAAVIASDIDLGTPNRIFDFDIDDGSADEDLLISGKMTGSAEMSKKGAGKMVLTSNANNYTGLMTVREGILNIRSNNALGGTSGGTIVLNGAQLQIQGGITVPLAETLSIRGTGINSDGALRSVSGNNTWGGDVSLAGNANIVSATAGDLLTIGASPSVSVFDINTRTVTFDGAGDILLKANISGSGNVIKNGTGTLTYGADENSYSGKTSVNDGMLVLDPVLTTSHAPNGLIIGSSLDLGDGVGAEDSAILRNGAIGTSVGSELFGDGASLNIYEDGLYDLNSQTETIGNLSMRGGEIRTGLGGRLILNGTFTTVASANTAEINGVSGFLDLSATDRTLNIADGAVENDMIISARIIGTGKFTKNGAGKLVLTNSSNAYSGNTTVNRGVLQVDGVIASAVTVNSNGTLSGSGSVTKAVTINGVGALMPGNKTDSGSGIGTFTLLGAGADGNLTLNSSGSSLRLQLGANGIAFANQSTDYYTSPGVLNAAYTNAANIQANANDRVIVGGTLSLNAGRIIDVSLLGYTPSLGDAFDLLDWTTLSQGGFSIGPPSGIRTGADNVLYDLKLPDIVSSGYRWDVSFFASRGIIVVVPEPSRALLLMVGIIACVMSRRRW